MLSMLLMAAVNFVEINPGHFHAALVLNKSYPDVNKSVRVYAPENGSELKAHLALVEQFNSRKDNPTSWNEVVYTGGDFLEKAIKDSKRGDVVILAGRNDLKGDYLLSAAKASLHVVSDKPMGINDEAFAKFEEAMRLAKENGVIIDDVMTERHEIFSIIQKELVNSIVYGQQIKGSLEKPAIEKESVHHFCKLVNGRPLQRPAWYYDVNKQGSGIADVTSHLVDIIQWSAFPNVKLCRDDVKILSAKVWDTPISAQNYKLSTGCDEWPEYLKSKVDENNVLQCEANGEFTYLLKGVAVKVSVIWNFIAENGSGDTHKSVMRGTRATVSIRQNKDTGFRPALFVEPAQGVDRACFESSLKAAVADIAKKYPGVEVGEHKDGQWRINIPKKYDIGHEAHFSQEIEEFLGWLKNGNRPEWEASNLDVKYWTIYNAWRMSRR